MPKITLPGGVLLEDVPKWTIAVVALMLAAFVIAIGYYLKVYQPELELVSALEANEVARQEIEEFGKHIGETSVSEYRLSDNPLMLARLYKDRCILLVSDTPDGVRSKLVRDLARDSHRSKKLTGVFSLPVVEAAQQRTRCDGFIHPGPFETKYGIKQGCWVPVWRIFRDNCAHVQNFDACHGTWDQTIRWTTCNH